MDTPTKIAVVTGAGSGIGRASAHALLEAGWAVALAGRRREMLEPRRSPKPAPRTLVVPTDIRDPVAVKALFDASPRSGKRALRSRNAASRSGPPAF